MMNKQSNLEKKVHSELTDVLDPCSCMTDRPVSIVDLGLVENISVEDSEANIRLLLTSQMCMYFVNMATEIKQKVGRIDGIENVNVSQEKEKIWTPDRMKNEEYQTRRQNFREKFQESGITPHAEQPNKKPTRE